MLDNYIQILDYGIGNIRSLANALNHIKIKNKVSSQIELNNKKLRGLIIPGVGAFPAAMRLLKKKSLLEKIKSLYEKKIPILGICLGMQILLTEGTEIEKKPGLGFFKGSVLPLDKKKMLVPNIGWRKIYGDDEVVTQAENLTFYFVHSYYVNLENKEYVKYYAVYENFKIPAIIRKNNLFGFQFHPEKSGTNGLNLLNNFCNIGINNINDF
jgi:glutamine amidotransferase